MAKTWLNILDSINQTYDGTTSGLTSTDVQSAIDELASSLGGSSTPYFPGQEELIESQTASSSANLDFDLPTGYREFILRWRDVKPATDSVSMHLAGSTDGGSTFLNSSGNYYYTYDYSLSSGASGKANSQTNTNGLYISGLLGNAATENTQGELVFTSAESTTLYKLARWRSSFLDASTISTQMGGAGSIRTTSAINAIRVVMSSGNITSGTFDLYGIPDTPSGSQSVLSVSSVTDSDVDSNDAITGAAGVLYLVTTTAGVTDITINLPSPSTTSDRIGIKFAAENSGSDTVVISPAAGDSINGSASDITLTATGDYRELISAGDSTNWYIVASV